MKDFWCQSCQKRVSDDALYHAGLAVVVGRVRLGRRGTDGGGLLESVHKRQKMEKDRDVIGWKMQEILSACTCFGEGTWALCTRFCASC